jgi:hypothetical protein
VSLSVSAYLLHGFCVKLLCTFFIFLVRVICLCSWLLFKSASFSSLERIILPPFTSLICSLYCISRAALVATVPLHFDLPFRLRWT